MTNVSFVNFLGSIFFFLSSLISAASANECNFVDDLNKLNNEDIIDNINFSCVDQLNPASYEKLALMIASEKKSSQTKENNSNRSNNYNVLIKKTINKYLSSKDQMYSNALLELLEGQKITRLQDYFSDECTPLNKAKIKTDKREAVLYMHSLPGNLFLTILIKKDKIFISRGKTSTVNDKVGALRLEIKNLKNSVEKKKSNTYQSLHLIAETLYDIILEPFSKELSTEVDHLVVVPDSTTGIFPIDVLIDKKSEKKYILYKNYSISYSPNLSQSPKNTHTRGSDILFVSQEAKKSSFSQGFSKDLDLLKRNYSSILSVQGSQATKSGLYNFLNKQSVGVLHIAAHAKFSQEFKQSYIQLHDSKKDSTQGKLYVKDFERMMVSVSARQKPPNLVVLSACESAQGGTGKNDASLGLAGVAARSGVSSVIAGLWILQTPEVLVGPEGGELDTSLGDNYSEYFYHIITNEPSVTKAEALQRSKQGIQENRSVYEWAALVLVGDWGVL